MPIYEYLCAKCKEKFCVLAQEPPKPQPSCPNCGSDKVFREWNAPNVIFRGDGFYTTDKRKDEEKKDEGK